MSDMPAPDLVGSERDVLLYYLGRMREAVISKSEGLSDADARRPMTPSGTHLLGMLRHLTRVEEHWFQRVFLGLPLGDFDDSWDVPADTSRAQLVTEYRAMCARSDEIVRGCADLSTVAIAENPGEAGNDSLRRITAHMLRETSRHAGQADIVRELLDGSVED